MMHMGPMFPVFGMFFGWIWVLILPVVIFFGIKFLRRLIAGSYRDVGKNGSKSLKDADQSIQNQILRLAFKKRGILTVTDVVLETGTPMRKAEEILNDMVDGYRVNMQVNNSGIIVYEFAEIINREETKNIR